MQEGSLQNSDLFHCQISQHQVCGDSSAPVPLKSPCLHTDPHHRTSSKYVWYLIFELPSCVVSFCFLSLYSQHLQISLGGDFQWQRAPCIESCCLSFWGTAAWKERNTRDVGWETVNQQQACEQSKPKARHLVGLSHHCLWSCRLLRFTWAVIFPSRKLTLPPFSQRHSQGHCLVSLPYQLSTFQIQRLSCHSYWI